MNYPDSSRPALFVRHTGQSFPLVRFPVTIGRQADNQIVLEDAQVSRRHATLYRQGGRFLIQDLNSANGTYVNEQRITAPQALRDGDVVRIGGTLLDMLLGTAWADTVETGAGYPAERTADTVQEPIAYPDVLPAEEGPSRLVWTLVGILIGLLFVAGIGLFLWWLSQRIGGPEVAILSPAPSTQAVAGSPIPLQASATGARDLVRLDLAVDGIVVASALSPEPAGTEALTVEQAWTFLQAGTHIVAARAYRAGGQTTDPAEVSVAVVEAVGQVTPAGVTPLPAGATSTDTPAAPVPTQAPPTAEVPVAEPTLAPPPTQPPPTTGPGGGGGGPRPSGPGVIIDFEVFGTWKRGDQPNGTFTQSAEQVHGGQYSGKLAYNFPTGGNDYVVFLQTHPCGGRPSQINAWVFGDGSKHYLNLWIRDAAGETWQFSLGRVRHTGWQQMVAWLDAAAAWPAGHVDGPSNGVVDLPVDFRGLVLDDAPDSYRGSGAIYIDDVRCDETGAPPPPPPTPTPTARPGPAPVVQFWADATTIPAGGSTTLRWHVENVQAVYLDGEPVTGPDGQKGVSPATTTTYELRVVVPGGEQIKEVTVTVTGAAAQYDLYVRRMDFSPADPAAGDTISANVMIATDVYPAAGPFFPASHFRWRPGEEYGWAEVNCPANWQYANCSATLTFSYPADGQYDFEVEADNRGEVAETDEGNNDRQWTITVTP